MRSKFATHRTDSEFEKSLMRLGFEITQKKSEILKTIITNLKTNLEQLEQI